MGIGVFFDSDTLAKRILLSRISFVPAILAVVVAQPVRGAITYDTVALSGTMGTSLGYGPNLGPQIDFVALADPVLNALGQVAFNGRISGPVITTDNDDGIWTKTGGSISVVAREGGTPGPNVGAGTTFSKFPRGSLLSDSGAVAFAATLKGTGIGYGNDDGVWISTEGDVSVVARSGSTGPGPNVGPGISFEHIFPWIRMSNAHVTAFDALLNPRSTPASNSDGIWANLNTALAPVARVGGEVPNLPGSTFVILTSGMGGLNDAGKLAIRGAATGGAGIWVMDNASATTVAFTGVNGPGPNLGAGVKFSNFDLSGPALNAAGATAFIGSLAGPTVGTTNDTGIWTNAGGSLAAIAREGTTELGPNLAVGVNFSTFSQPVLNGAGAVAFVASVAGPGVVSTNDKGIWINKNGSNLAIAREGDTSLGPQLGDGIQFRDFSPLVSQLQMNSYGDIAFRASVTGTGVNSGNDDGIWSWSAGELKMIVREGELLDVNPDPSVEDFRTINSIDFGIFGYPSGSGGQDSMPRILNDDGLLVFGLGFTDGTSGIFTAQLPREAGDFDNDGDVDGADLVSWQAHFPLASGATLATGDADGDGDVDGADFVVWQTHYGAGQAAGANVVPEPAGVALLLCPLLIGVLSVSINWRKSR